MSKKHWTCENICDAIAAEFVWRIHELSTVKAAILTAKNKNEDAYVRQGVLILYAHWEGFVKMASLMFLQLSKGMFRALYLLIYMEYLANIKKPSMLLVDELCEGLDYDRSTRLGRIVFDFCLQHNIQLIASSNDSFLMDVVDLKYWNILQRKGSVIEGINHINHPELFDDFEFTGLSNFDLFSSDYIARHLNDKVDE